MSARPKGQERPYSRHYHELVDDPKFREVYPDDRHYACWSRLLMLADQAWPASAPIPASARAASVRKLADVGLIDLLPSGRFRMHGLDAERRVRSQSAKDAADARWESVRNADGNADGNAERNATASDVRMPRRDETSRDEKRRAKGERDVVVHDGAPAPEGTVVIGLVDPPEDRHPCPTCSRRMVEAMPGRWVCTNAPGHGASVTVTA